LYPNFSVLTRLESAVTCGSWMPGSCKRSFVGRSLINFGAKRWRYNSDKGMHIWAGFFEYEYIRVHLSIISECHLFMRAPGRHCRTCRVEGAEPVHTQFRREIFVRDAQAGDVLARSRLLKLHLENKRLRVPPPRARAQKERLPVHHPHTGDARFMLPVHDKELCILNRRHLEASLFIASSWRAVTPAAEKQVRVGRPQSSIAGALFTPLAVRAAPRRRRLDDAALSIRGIAQGMPLSRSRSGRGCFSWQESGSSPGVSPTALSARNATIAWL